MLEQLTTGLDVFIVQTQTNAYDLLIVTLIPWIVFVVNLFIGKRLLYLGIFPRRAHGLTGVVFAPLLHANFNHLFFNTIPFVVLSDFLLINGFPYYLEVTVLITFFSGMLIWTVCKPGLYVGASALITGYWALLVLDIYQRGTVTAILLGVVSLYYFAGIFSGLFPREKGGSWQGHVCGFVAGIATSYLIKG